MPEYRGRARFLHEHPRARAWAALDEATNRQRQTTPGAIQLRRESLRGKRAVVVGSGVAGLATAYELLAQQCGVEVHVLEAHARAGGRCLSLRTGDTLTEDRSSDLFDRSPGETQSIRFEQPLGDGEPYLNAGPGRIPSSHKRLLSYLRDFGVAVEVYVMNSESNLVQMRGGPRGDRPEVYRQIDHGTRGWLAQLVYQNAEQLIESSAADIDPDDAKERADQLRSLMVSFGELTKDGHYAPSAGQPGLENARARGGFDVLPGIDAGRVARALGLDALLRSEFWAKTRFYQPSDFLWQPTLFQPVGGMDRVQHAFAQRVASLGGTLHLGSPVRSIAWDAERREFVVRVEQMGVPECRELRADYCFSNVALPFLREILDERLQSPSHDGGFAPEFKTALHAVYRAQFDPADPGDDGGYAPRFLAATTKVGWQAERSLWQGSPITPHRHEPSGEDVLGVPQSELGVVPIFGGISWTDHEIVQIWYPSAGYHDRMGVLTGAYNFSRTAFEWGKLPIEERLRRAREGAERFGREFAEGLRHGVAIAWQNMPYIKGGWAQWHAVDDAVQHFNALVQGTGVRERDGTLGDPRFFVIGDQVSALPGWQEGALASAQNAISRLARPDLEIPHLSALPDTRWIVEGI